MVGHKILIVVSLVLFAAGVAAAQSMLIGPSPGIAVNNGSVVAQSAPSTTTTTGTTTGPSTGTPGTTGTAAADSGTTTTGTTTGTTGTTTTTTPTVVPGTTTNAVTINQIVSISRAVPEGTPVNAFTVPAGQQLVITDVIVTNPGTTASCGASVTPSGTTTTTTTTTTTGAVTTTGTTETGTGILCVPAQTSLNLGLTTGLEFSPGQNVVLGNAATAGGVATATTLQFLLRGFLISGTGA
jgi:hypothetical protein